MTAGMIVRWILIVLIAAIIFVIAKWAVPTLFQAVGITIPSNVAGAIALLIALLVVYGGWTYGRAA